MVDSTASLHTMGMAFGLPSRWALQGGIGRGSRARTGTPMPTIAQVLTELDAQLFVGRESELALFRQWLSAESPEPVILNVTGPGGLGKSALLHAFRRVALELGRPVVLADAQAFGGDHQGLL